MYYKRPSFKRGGSTGIAQLTPRVHAKMGFPNFGVGQGDNTGYQKYLETMRANKASEQPSGIASMVLGPRYTDPNFVSPFLKKDSPFFSNLQSFEVVYRGGNEVVLHLFSTRRISDKCTFGGVDLSKYYKGKRVICIGAKASLTDGNGQSIIGCVFDENENELGVRMNDTGEVAWVVRPTFDYTSNTYVYDEVGLSQHDAVGSFAITYLWPIRIKINITSGRSCIMYSFSSCIDNDN